MSTYVLIHGAWHGAWCWYKVIPRLVRNGHRVVAPDLASLGRDKTPISEVTLQRWTEDVARVVDAQNEPVVLVGHSRGGIVISEVAESRPEKVRTLVYVSAFLLRDGESLRQVAASDSASLVTPNMVIDAAQGSALIRDEAIREAFYGECGEEDVALARLLLQPEALAPLDTPIRTTEKNFGRIARIYVACLRDRAVSPESQQQMYTALPCARLISMDTDHSPFFSQPEELARHLHAV